MTTDIRTREQRARRTAHRLGLRLVKARTRTERAAEHGTYMIADVDTSCVVSKGLPAGYGLTLEDVERELAE